MFFYRLLLMLISPLLLLHLTWQALQHRSLRYLLQRTGWAYPHFNTPPLWLHAASVGEVNAALPLLQRIRREHPQLPLLLTCNTPTGGEHARRKLPPGITQAYLPVDWPLASRRLARRIRPHCLLVMETELWPHLFSAVHRTGCPIIIVNARLSSRTLQAPSWLRSLYRRCLQQCRAILARSQQDAEGFTMLGAREEQLSVIGNIKFAATMALDSAPFSAGRDYVLAASTRDAEEALIMRAWQAGERNGRLLVIVPRHPQRLPAIEKQLAPLTSEIAVRSRGEAISETTEVYIADTFGELPAFIAGAELVIMGGSLVPKGGQNLLEAAARGKAIITGPHMDNFADETRLLKEGEALVQVDDWHALAASLDELLGDNERLQALGEAGAKLTAQFSNIDQLYLQALRQHCDLGSGNA